MSIDQQPAPRFFEAEYSSGAIATGIAVSLAASAFFGMKLASEKVVGFSKRAWKCSADMLDTVRLGYHDGMLQRIAGEDGFDILAKPVYAQREASCGDDNRQLQAVRACASIAIGVNQQAKPLDPINSPSTGDFPMERRGLAQRFKQRVAVLGNQMLSMVGVPDNGQGSAGIYISDPNGSGYVLPEVPAVPLSSNAGVSPK